MTVLLMSAVQMHFCIGSVVCEVEEAGEETSVEVL
jgi:hypothetical protein